MTFQNKMTEVMRVKSQDPSGELPVRVGLHEHLTVRRV